MAILPAISQESYVRAYPQVARLHMLQVARGFGKGSEVLRDEVSAVRMFHPPRTPVIEAAQLYD